MGSDKTHQENCCVLADCLMLAVVRVDYVRHCRPLALCNNLVKTLGAGVVVSYTCVSCVDDDSMRIFNA